MKNPVKWPLRMAKIKLSRELGQNCFGFEARLVAGREETRALRVETQKRSCFEVDQVTGRVWSRVVSLAHLRLGSFQNCGFI